jgi:hypothetical protein
MTHNLFFAVPVCIAVACVFICALTVFGSKTISWLKKPTKGSSYESKMEYLKKMDQANGEYIATLVRKYDLDCEVHIFDELYECDCGKISHVSVFPDQICMWCWMQHFEDSVAPPVFARVSRLPLWLRRLLTISGILSVSCWFTGWAIRTLEKRNPNV